MRSAAHGALNGDRVVLADAVSTVLGLEHDASCTARSRAHEHTGRANDTTTGTCVRLHTRARCGNYPVLT